MTWGYREQGRGRGKVVGIISKLAAVIILEPHREHMTLPDFRTETLWYDA